jgi:hypothetical protein
MGVAGEKKPPRKVAFLLRPRITWQQREQKRQQPEREQQPERKRQQPEREQRREPEQQPEPEQQEQLPLLFCHKQPERQQRSQRPKRGICSFGLPNELKKQFPEIANAVLCIDQAKRLEPVSLSQKLYGQKTILRIPYVESLSETQG